jgi:Reverse transcriptase (RNA-dependent DNA polymerase)
MTPVAFTASSDPDVLYMHKAMQQKDKPQFIMAMNEEVPGQTISGNWVLVERDKLPIGTQIFPCVWAMRLKQQIMDGTVYKWKATLNVDGGKQIHGIDYWETYAPIATWIMIRLILIMGVKERWCMKQLDFIQA